MPTRRCAFFFFFLIKYAQKQMFPQTFRVFTETFSRQKFSALFSGKYTTYLIWQSKKGKMKTGKKIYTLTYNTGRKGRFEWYSVQNDLSHILYEKEILIWDSDIILISRDILISLDMQNTLYQIPSKMEKLNGFPSPFSCKHYSWNPVYVT